MDYLPPHRRERATPVQLLPSLLLALTSIIPLGGCMQIATPTAMEQVNGTIPYIQSEGGNWYVKVKPGFKLVFINGLTSRQNTVTPNYEATISSFDWTIPRCTKVEWTNRDVIAFGFLLSHSTLRFDDQPNPDLAHAPVPGDYLTSYVLTYSTSKPPLWDDSVNQQALDQLRTLRLELGSSSDELKPTGATWNARDFRNMYRSNRFDLDASGEKPTIGKSSRILTWQQPPLLKPLTSGAHPSSKLGPREDLTQATRGFVSPFVESTAKNDPNQLPLIRNSVFGASMPGATNYVVTQTDIEIPIELNGEELYVPVTTTVKDLERHRHVNVLELKRRMEKSLDDVSIENARATSAKSHGDAVSKAKPLPRWGCDLVIWFSFAPLPFAPVLYSNDELKGDVVLSSGDRIFAENGAYDAR